MSVYLYAGRGADPFCVQKTIESFKEYLGDQFDRLIPINDSSYIANREWFKDVKTIVIPGGGALMTQTDLGTEGCEKIRRFVAQGGRYLGFCAGAYLATDFSFKYNKDTPYESHKSKLSITSFCRLKGPYISEFNEEGRQVSHTVDSGRLVPLIGREKDYYIYWNGGGSFGYHDPMVQDVYARYRNGGDGAALVDCRGVTLSNVHPEIRLTEEELQQMPQATEEERKFYLESLPQQKELFKTLCMFAGIRLQ